MATFNKSWVEYYLPKVNNLESELNFKMKYESFLRLIQQVTLKNNISNIVELGCGTGIITKLLLKDAPIQVLGDKNFILSDISKEMLELTRLNMIGIEPKSHIAERRLGGLQYIQHDILDSHTLTYERYIEERAKSDLFITHGVLEHFSKEVVQQIILNMNEDERVAGHIHYVPTDEYTTKSFGDENLWSVSEWLELTKPEIAIKNGPDLFLYINNKK